MFVELGDRIGRLEQIVSFWDYRFSDRRMAGMSPDEAFDGLRDLLQALSVSLALPSSAAEPEAPRRPLSRATAKVW